MREIPETGIPQTTSKHLYSPKCSFIYCVELRHGEPVERHASCKEESVRQEFDVTYDPRNELSMAQGASARVHTGEVLSEVARWACATDEEDNTRIKTILLVEDEAFVREVTCEVLRSAGYEVLPARDSREAQGIYDERCGNVDMLLTDVVLPGEAGQALAEKLRCQDPELRVLLVTGYAEHMGLRETRNQDCLAKPFSTEVLLRRVRRLLNCGASEVERDLVTRACGIA